MSGKKLGTWWDRILWRLFGDREPSPELRFRVGLLSVKAMMAGWEPDVIRQWERECLEAFRRMESPPDLPLHPRRRRHADV